MTRSQILALEAGFELDHLVARNVLGWSKPLQVHCESCHDPNVVHWLDHAGQTRHGVLPLYSTDISAAWEVVEKMRASGRMVVANSARLPDTTVPIGSGHQVEFQGLDDGRWYVVFYRCAGIRCDGDGHGWADTLPLAICRAALLAVMEAE